MPSILMILLSFLCADCRFSSGRPVAIYLAYLALLPPVLNAGGIGGQFNRVLTLLLCCIGNEGGPILSGLRHDDTRSFILRCLNLGACLQVCRWPWQFFCWIWASLSILFYVGYALDVLLGGIQADYSQLPGKPNLANSKAESRPSKLLEMQASWLFCHLLTHCNRCQSLCSVCTGGVVSCQPKQVMRKLTTEMGHQSEGLPDCFTVDKCRIQNHREFLCLGPLAKERLNLWELSLDVQKSEQCIAVHGMSFCAVVRSSSLNATVTLESAARQ
jgi:hypothetical protein